MNQNMGRSAKAWKIAAMAFFAIGTFCGQARAVNDVLSKWTMESVTAPVGTPLTSGTFNAENGLGNTASGTHAVATTWSTPAGNGSAKSFSVNTWSGGDYWEFTADDQGSGFSNYGLQFDQVSSTTGPRDFKLQYSTTLVPSFTDFATYSVQPNANPGWSSVGAVAPAGLDTFDFDLRSITALNGNPNAKIRLTAAASPVAAQQGSAFVGTTGTDRVDNVSIFYNYDPAQSPVTQPPATPVLPAAGDIVVGLGSGRQKTTLELVRGSVTPGGGTRPAPYSSWTAQNFSRFVKFDNLGGSNAHNVHGNLLALDTGATTAGGGNIYSYATQGSIPSPAPQLLANTGSTSGSAAATTIGGLSVSPDNTKIALSGFNTGKVIVYDYTAGNGLGTGSPALSGLRQSTAILGTGTNYTAGSQQGTAWLNNSTVLAFAGDGKLYTVPEGSMTPTMVKDVAITTATQSSTALAYNPNVSPYIYATYSSFVTAGAVTTNKLYVFDPAASFADLTAGGLDFTTSTPNTVRDIALDASGNLFLVTNVSSATPTGNSARLEYVSASNLASLTANSAVEWYYDDIFQQQPGFTGLDIGFTPPGLIGDYNGDGKVNSQDYVIWRKTNVNGAQGYTDWRSHYGNGGVGSGSGLGGASVPEPASVVLLLVGLVTAGWRRRRA